MGSKLRTVETKAKESDILLEQHEAEGGLLKPERLKKENFNVGHNQRDGLDGGGGGGHGGGPAPLAACVTTSLLHDSTTWTTITARTERRLDSLQNWFMSWCWVRGAPHHPSLALRLG